ncbi:hypothetical protein Q7P35_002125 [Cladosporium inversicolor]
MHVFLSNHSNHRRALVALREPAAFHHPLKSPVVCSSAGGGGGVLPDHATSGCLDLQRLVYVQQHEHVIACSAAIRWPIDMDTLICSLRRHNRTRAMQAPQCTASHLVYHSRCLAINDSESRPEHPLRESTWSETANFLPPPLRETVILSHAALVCRSAGMHWCVACSLESSV